MISDLLKSVLREYKLNDEIINDVIDSGYFTIDGQTVLDSMYGNKMFSSCFELDKFLAYLNGEDSFSNLREYSSFVTYKAKNIDDIKKILSSSNRIHHINEGTLSYRGQIEEYYFERKVPNPFRRIKTPDNLNNKELAILPGLYRSAKKIYSFADKVEEKRQLLYYLHYFSPELEYLNAFDLINSRDAMRVEQHYGNPTGGLDISFDIETAIFFATHKYINEGGKATYKKISTGEHKGVIYCFRFVSPPVKETEFLIRDFEFCKKYIPTRILRQKCGLPIFSLMERNIAICDIDCIIYLDKDFEYSGARSPQYMFPDENDDKFYAKLMQVKKEHPDLFQNVPEYYFE